MINRERIINTFCELAKIDSLSGQELDISKELIKRLSNIGIKAKLDTYGNVVSQTNSEKTLILSAHMDTVQPGTNVKPIVTSDRISSDGTTILGGDCKAGITAILEGLTSLKEDRADYTDVEIIFKAIFVAVPAFIRVDPVIISRPVLILIAISATVDRNGFSLQVK